ncbi:hypothetical protein QQP08_006247, partial [Theobroma cacao]
GNETEKGERKEMNSLNVTDVTCSLWLDESRKSLPVVRGKKKEMEETSLGLSFTKDENFREWYSEIYFVAVNSEMIECNDISSYYILRPWAISTGRLMLINYKGKNGHGCHSLLICDVKLHTFFDVEIKKTKVKNYDFPLFVSPSVLQKEKDHIEGFAPKMRINHLNLILSLKEQDYSPRFVTKKKQQNSIETIPEFCKFIKNKKKTVCVWKDWHYFKHVPSQPPFLHLKSKQALTYCLGLMTFNRN